MNLYPIKTKITALFKQGLTPKNLSQSILLSALLSVIPIIGISTLLITTIGFSLRKHLNLPVMLALNYVLWPIQIVLIIPFIRIGESIFLVEAKSHSIAEIVSSFQNNFFETISQLSFELLCGIGGWFCTALPITLAIYSIILLILKAKNTEY